MSRVAKIIHSILAFACAVALAYIAVTTDRVPDHYPWIIIIPIFSFAAGIGLYVLLYQIAKGWYAWIMEPTKAERESWSEPVDPIHGSEE